MNHHTLFSRLKEHLPRELKPRVKFKKKFLRGVVHLFAWLGIAIIYYVAFSFFFDTPLEYRMKHSTRKLQQEYDSLSMRYDMVEKVLTNVVERDKAIFKNLFESEPYEFGQDFEKKRWENYEKLLTKSNKALAAEFFSKLNALDRGANLQLRTLTTLERASDSLQSKLDYIPSIQPVNNRDLTLLTASYGMRIHPFYKSLASHQGIDYTVNEGSRVFATADGTVKDIITRQTSGGITVILNHGNSYETTYSHLSKVNVSKGQRVRRGDIIAQSGNTGLSLAPHLHYEIRHRGVRIDPIHFFFMELDYRDYQKIIRIAQSGMQSFD